MSYLFVVTGANGHLGNSVVRELLDRHYKVRGLILPSDSGDMLMSLGVDVVYGDITVPSSLSPLFIKDDHEEIIVIHTAGIVSISSKKHKLLDKVNIDGTKNIVDLSLLNHVKRFIHVSSVHAIPELDHQEIIKEVPSFDPNLVIGAYAKSKAIATQYVLDQVDKGLDAVVVHPSGIIGPYDFGKAHMTMMIEDYLNGYLTSRINGAYDFVDVRDVSTGIISAAFIGKKGECYILSGNQVSIKKLFDDLKKYSGKKLRINVLPLWFAKISAPFAELYYKMRKLPPIYTSYSLYTLKSNSMFSKEKAVKELNYHVRSFEVTIFETMAWLVGEKRIKRLRIIHFIKNNQFIKN
jgi:dihydroflavonol-4-reductase